MTAPRSSAEYGGEARSTSIEYVPALDGLRALAIVGILVFHTVPMSLPGGFIGVDIFFVLSGFLIASVIAHQVTANEFRFREFYRRRARRLAPNAILVILVTVLLWLLFLTPSTAVRVARLALTALFGVSNIYLSSFTVGYWAEGVSSLPLLHTWALSLEIQFFLLFPVLFWFLLRRSKRLMYAVLGVLLVSSLVGMVVVSRTQPAAAFYLFPTRAWQFLMGATLALPWIQRPLALSSRSRVAGGMREFAGWGGIIVILFAFIVVNSGDRFFGLGRIAPTLGAALAILAVLGSRGWLAKALSWRPVVAVGKISYSLFLWHLPLLVFWRLYGEMAQWPSYVGTTIGLATGVVLSVVAYRWVERPLRSERRGRPKHLVLVGVGFVACVALATSVALWKPISDSENLFDQVVSRGFAYDSYSNEPPQVIAVESQIADVYFPPYEPRPEESWQTGGIIHLYGSATPQVVVIGSSHGMMYAGQLDDICRDLKISVAFILANGRRVITPQGEAFDRLDDDARAFYEARGQWLSEWRPDAAVVIDRWDRSDSLRADLPNFLAELERSAGSVILISQVPVLELGQSINLREYMSWYYSRNATLPTIMPDFREQKRKESISIFEAEADNDPRLVLIRADVLFYNDDQSVRYCEERDFFYSDDDHLAEAGTKLLEEPLTEAIAEACGVEVGVGALGQSAARR